MLISDLEKRFGFTAVMNEYKDRELSSAYTSDLLSDVMTNGKADGVLITIQAHKNSIAVASFVNLAAVVICNNRECPEDMIKAAKEEGIAVFVTRHSQFEVSGMLWAVFGHKQA